MNVFSLAILIFWPQSTSDDGSYIAQTHTQTDRATSLLGRAAHFFISSSDQLAGRSSGRRCLFQPLITTFFIGVTNSLSLIFLLLASTFKNNDVHSFFVLFIGRPSAQIAVDGSKFYCCNCFLSCVSLYLLSAKRE